MTLRQARKIARRHGAARWDTSPYSNEQLRRASQRMNKAIKAFGPQWAYLQSHCASCTSPMAWLEPAGTRTGLDRCQWVKRAGMDYRITHRERGDAAEFWLVCSRECGDLLISHLAD